MAQGLIIDTNLLLLLVIGAVEEGRYIKISKRLNAFDLKDYDIVVKYMAQYDKVFITSYIATEVSNLIDLDGRARIIAYEIAKTLFSIFVQIDSKLIEDSAPDYFLNYGITDASLIGLVENFCVLTNDDRMLPMLYGRCPDNVVPFAMLREINR